MTTMRAKPPPAPPAAARRGSALIDPNAAARDRDASARDIVLSSPPARIEVRWCCTATACAAILDMPAESFAIHDLAELIVTVTITDVDRGQLEAHVALAEHHRNIIAPQTVAIITHEHDAWRHLDAVLDDRTILQLSWCDGEPRYAQTTLLIDAGLPGGSYDRPRAMIVN